jgi:uncharacterized protein (DUF934 family)
MPRRLLRDGRIVADDWSYAAEAAEAGNAPAVIVSLDQWRNERDRWTAHRGQLGVVLLPPHRVEQIAADLPLFSLIACSFPGPSEGRGYSQARILRERLNFSGELRAAGYVRRDQLFFLARCGFNSFELPDTDIEDAAEALSTFSKAYQPSNDAGLPFKLQHRWPNIPANA